MSMLPFGVLGCLSPVLLIGLVAICIRMLWLSLMPPSKMSREAACGSCGYSVAGLTTPACPECGADWRDAGITTPALIMRHRGGTGGAIVAWTILAVGAGLIVTAFFGIFYTRQMVTTMTTKPQTWTTPLTPASKAYANVDVLSSSMMSGRGGATSVGLELTLLDGLLWKIDVDATTKTWIVTSPSAAGRALTGAYGAGSVGAFLKTAGLDTTDPKIAAEAAELERVVDIQLMSPYTQPSQMTLTAFTVGTPSFSGVSAATWNPMGAASTGFILLGLAFLWLIVYIVGIVLIVARRKKLMGRYITQHVYSPGM